MFYLKKYSVICFDVDTKEIIKCAEIGLDYLAEPISMSELKAINEKVKELGWEV